ncbi:MAG: type II toxin-antitoxin system Phd/YefM family antitoxin [Spirochaetaceae bacterium]|nr:type II toxin-antitoxin system Phd/YefM family antitoxin [Spirochaetaceae bacterium]MBO4706875.1 type II toxin-antitoxin system Phd/YefM family antitoxin [Spirochaetaceae bacterium]
MRVMTYSEARQNFASVLDRSEAEGAVLVKRADGSMFRISPETKNKSPFEGIKTLCNLKKTDILNALRETREEN